MTYGLDTLLGKVNWFLNAFVGCTRRIPCGQCTACKREWDCMTCAVCINKIFGNSKSKCIFNRCLSWGKGKPKKESDGRSDDEGSEGEHYD